MSKAAYTYFIDLIELEREISDLLVKLSVHQNNILDFKEKLKLLDNQEQQAAQNLLNIQKEIDIVDLEIKALDESKKDKKVKLEKASNNRQSSSLEHELEVIKEKQNSHEESIFKLWDKQGLLKKEYNKITSENPNAKNIINKLILEEEANIESISNRINNTKKEILEVELKLKDTPAQNLILDKNKNLNMNLIEFYKSMKDRIPNPAIPVINDSCSACFYAIVPTDLQSLKQSNLISCKDCYRLLYNRASNES